MTRTITLKYEVITAKYGDEEEYDIYDFEVDYTEEDIIKHYGFDDTPNNRKVIADMIDCELLNVEEDETFIDYLKDKYQEDFDDYMAGDGNPAELQIWDVM